MKGLLFINTTKYKSINSTVQAEIKKMNYLYPAIFTKYVLGADFGLHYTFFIYLNMMQK